MKKILNFLLMMAGFCAFLCFISESEEMSLQGYFISKTFALLIMIASYKIYMIYGGGDRK